MKSGSTGGRSTSRFREGGSYEDEAGYSRAVRHGQLIAVSGTTCRPECASLGTKAQTTDCLRRVVAAVERLGGAREGIVRTRVFLAPGADWQEAAEAHLEVLGDVAPANTMLFAHGLIGDRLLVQVEAEAWVAADDDSPWLSRSARARFSLRLNNDLRVGEFTELARAAEASGFDQVWISHDLFWRSAPVLVAAAAAATTRIGLGIGIMNPFSAHPAELAMHAATLAELSGGRFALGLGAGAEEFLAWAGLARPRPLSATREAVLACRALLRRERPADDPALIEAGSAWRPEAHLRWDGPRVPIYIAAMGPRMLALAGEIGDGVLALSFPPERAAASAEIVRSAARNAGRDPASLDIPACFWCSIDDDPARAARPLADKLAYYGQSISPAQLAEAGLRPDSFAPAARALERGDLEGARDLVSPQMLRLGIYGDAATIIERCRHLIEAGSTHLSFGPPLGPDPVEAVLRLGREVLPALAQ